MKTINLILKRTIDCALLLVGGVILLPLLLLFLLINRFDFGEFKAMFKRVLKKAIKEVKEKRKDE